MSYRGLGDIPPIPDDIPIPECLENHECEMAGEGYVCILGKCQPPAPPPPVMPPPVFPSPSTTPASPTPQPTYNGEESEPDWAFWLLIAGVVGGLAYLYGRKS